MITSATRTRGLVIAMVVVSAFAEAIIDRAAITTRRGSGWDRGHGPTTAAAPTSVTA